MLTDLGDWNALQRFNLFEGLFWCGLTWVLIPVSLRASPTAKIQRRATVGFVCYGLTDWMEIAIGAWFQPGLLPWQVCFACSGCWLNSWRG